MTRRLVPYLGAAYTRRVVGRQVVMESSRVLQMCHNGGIGSGSEEAAQTAETP